MIVCISPHHSATSFLSARSASRTTTSAILWINRGGIMTQVRAGLALSSPEKNLFRFFLYDHLHFYFVLKYCLLVRPQFLSIYAHCRLFFLFEFIFA